MELPSTTSDDGPASIHRSFIYFSALLLICLSACRQHPEKKPSHLLTDTTAVIETTPKNPLQKKKKKIYLTFDDGPNRGTRNVLNTIKAEAVPVSFFVVGKHVYDSRTQQELWTTMQADSSLELCNHSYTHAANQYTRFYNSPETVVADFNRSRDSLHFDNNIARMPGRNAWRIDTINITDIRSSKAAIDSLHQAGYAIMGWDLEWSFDHKTFAPDPDTGYLLRRIYNLLEANTTRTPGHLVLLAHDQAFQKEQNLEILHGVLQQLKQTGSYDFELASRYPGIK